MPRWAKWIFFLIEQNRLLPCFRLSALYIVYSTCQHLTLPASLALLHRCTVSISLYLHSWFNSQRRRVAPPPTPFPIYSRQISIVRNRHEYCATEQEFIIKFKNKQIIKKSYNKSVGKTTSQINRTSAINKNKVIRTNRNKQQN